MHTDSEIPKTCHLTYAAMRAAFIATLDSLLRYSIAPESLADRPVGFLSCYPMLNGMAPQIQLECLLETWKVMNHDTGAAGTQSGIADSTNSELSENEASGQGASEFEATGTRKLLHELVLYAAYDALAKIANERRSHALKVVQNGPRGISVVADQWLYSKTRCLQAVGSNPLQPHFLRELGRIQDPEPLFDAEMGMTWHETREELLSLLGRWAANKDLILGSEGLLTSDENDILRAFFEEHPGLGR